MLSEGFGSCCVTEPIDIDETSSVAPSRPYLSTSGFIFEISIYSMNDSKSRHVLTVGDVFDQLTLSSVVAIREVVTTAF
jgi:hypothetical protein